MPVAPLAKGFIFSLSLLIAAGLAVYDNPQVREWIDESRRRIALAINDLSEDLQRSSSSRIISREDVSTSEDSSPEATERRRQAREEILRRGRVFEEQRRARARQTGEKMSSSFDQLVNSDGSLKDKEKELDLDAIETAITTAAEKMSNEGLRNRTKEATGAAMGSVVANPFADEMGMDAMDEKASLEPFRQLQLSQQERERSVTIGGDSPPVIDTDVARRDTRVDNSNSTHDSDLLVDLTPTTSAAPSMSATLLSSSPVFTPTSTHHPDSNSLGQAPGQPSQPPSFQSIQEWASTASTGHASFYSPPESERHYRDIEIASESGSQATSTAISVIGSNEARSEMMGDIDTMSDVGRLSTPSTWSEVGSVLSEE